MEVSHDRHHPPRTTPTFARPHLADILGALDFVIAKDYPARGEVTNLPAAAA
jgi:hypothetical protein